MNSELPVAYESVRKVFCPGCGYGVTSVVVEAALYDYGCPQCGAHGLRSFAAPAPVRAWLGMGGALLLDRQVPGLTGPRLERLPAGFYGGEWFVCESLSESAAERIAEALGFTFCGRVRKTK